MKIIWNDKAWEEYVEWQTIDRKVVKKINELIKDIATTKMELHPYTVRKDALPEFFTDVNQMYDALLNKAGATGVFTDFPDLGVQFLEKQKTKK